MKFYEIALGVYIFVLVVSMVNDLGIFQSKMPENDLNASQSEATITNLIAKTGPAQDESSFDKLFGGVGIILGGFEYMLNVFWKSINIVSIARQYQIDDKISMPFQALYSFVLVFGFISWLTGRNTKIIE